MVTFMNFFKFPGNHGDLKNIKHIKTIYTSDGVEYSTIEYE